MEAADVRQFNFATQAPKLPSSQAPKLPSSQAPWLFRVSGTALAAGVSATQRHCSLAIAIFLGIASLLFSSGCGVSNATSSVGKTEVDAAALEIDAGVIFSDRASYLCLPLSRFGISNSDDIETIVSSCECVKPSLVRYSDSSTTTADGVLFEFIPDEVPPDTTPQPMGLGVVTTFTMVGGETRTVTVNFLHAPAPVLSERNWHVPVSLVRYGTRFWDSTALFLGANDLSWHRMFVSSRREVSKGTRLVGKTDVKASIGEFNDGLIFSYWPRRLCSGAAIV